MQEYARDQYCSMDALHFLMSIYVTGGISGGATRKLEASEIEIAVRKNRSRLRRQESTQYICLILHIIIKYSLEKISWSENACSSKLVRADQIWKMFADNIADNWRQFYW